MPLVEVVTAPEEEAVPEPELIEFPQDEPAATSGAQPCATVRVLSSHENAEMVERLGASRQYRNVVEALTTAKQLMLETMRMK